jgi:hypothetical protein
MEGKKIAFISKSGPLKRNDQIWSMKTIPSGTRFTIKMDVEMPWGIIGKIMEKLFIGSMVGKHIIELLDNLKKLVESE